MRVNLVLNGRDKVVAEFVGLAVADGLLEHYERVVEEGEETSSSGRSRGKAHQNVAGAVDAASWKVGSRIYYYATWQAKKFPVLAEVKRFSVGKVIKIEPNRNGHTVDVVFDEYPDDEYQGLPAGVFRLAPGGKVPKAVLDGAIKD